jgi:hypothetical protein
MFGSLGVLFPTRRSFSKESVPQLGFIVLLLLCPSEWKYVWGWEKARKKNN